MQPDELTTFYQKALMSRPSDTLQPGIFSRDGAPSRPPSRASARGVSSGVSPTTGKPVWISVGEQYR